MKSRKLRIAWSVAWGILAVLLCVLWVRSYSRWDCVSRTGRAGISTTIESSRGTIRLISVDWSQVEGSAIPQPRGWMHEESELDPFDEDPEFSFVRIPVMDVFSAPSWFLAIFCAAAGGAPWIPKRFSLRTLLIAATLIAVVLGIIVWMSRAG